MSASKIISNLKKASCSTCNGKGITKDNSYSHTSLQNCSECNGTGWNLDMLPDYSIEALDNLEIES